MIERLLKAGVDANATGPEGETALMTAARTGSVERRQNAVWRTAPPSTRARAGTARPR